jgi:hypothetical protein
LYVKRFGFEIVERSGMRGYNYKLSSRQPCEWERYFDRRDERPILAWESVIGLPP